MQVPVSCALQVHTQAWEAFRHVQHVHLVSTLWALLHQQPARAVQQVNMQMHLDLLDVLPALLAHTPLPMALQPACCALLVNTQVMG